SAVRAVALRQLDRTALDVIDDAEFVAARADHVHVFADVRHALRRGGAATAARLLGVVLRLLTRLVGTVARLVQFLLRPVGGLLDALADFVTDLRRRLRD